MRQNWVPVIEFIALAKAVLRPTPLIRLGAARRTTFSRKGIREDVAADRATRKSLTRRGGGPTPLGGGP
ncbi:MAG: hypothetical protein ABWY13_07590, partial [Mesorhizobium sp.]